MTRKPDNQPRSVRKEWPLLMQETLLSAILLLALAASLFVFWPLMVAIYADCVVRSFPLGFLFILLGAVGTLGWLAAVAYVAGLWL